MKRLRLVKVIVQPVFAIDDGEDLTEMVADPIPVAAAAWPDFPERFEAERQAQEKVLNAAPNTTV